MTTRYARIAGLVKDALITASTTFRADQYRAYERADWTASVIGPEWKSLVLFRAAEREGR